MQLQWPDPFAVIDQANLADSTKIQYKRALQRYLSETGAPITDPDALTEYAKTLPKSGWVFLRAAVRLVIDRVATMIKSRATSSNVNQVQARLYQFEAILEAVPIFNHQGNKLHIWLSLPEVKLLLDSCGLDIYGRRDRVVIGILVGAGLRRQEAVDLRFEDLKLRPVNGKVRTVLVVPGKGDKNRLVPISNALAREIAAWAKVVGGKGRILRSLGMNREPGDSLSGQGVFEIVRKRGRAIGKPNLAPHDLRRTYAQLGYEAGVPITQISRLLGHASIEGTHKYLNLDLNLERTVGDVIPF